MVLKRRCFYKWKRHHMSLLKLREMKESAEYGAALLPPLRRLPLTVCCLAFTPSGTKSSSATVPKQRSYVLAQLRERGARGCS